ncbi:unnamed protein product [Brassica oleracea]
MIASSFTPSSMSLLRLGRRLQLTRTTPWTCFVFLIHLRCRLKTEPPRTSLPQASSLRCKSSCLDRVIRPSPWSYSTDAIMLGFKTRRRAHLRSLSLVTEEKEKQW